MQVDERFPYFLANPNSDFGLYSATDQELTYEWDEETWRKTAGECVAEYPDDGAPTQDPVATLDLDDEIAFQATDAGAQAPAEAPGPYGTGDRRQEVALADPLTGATSYVYFFQRPGGSSFDAGNGYVHYERDADADEWIDRYSFAQGDPEQLGSSNTGYGPNLTGTVCRTDAESGLAVPDGTPRESQDRFPRDGVTVSTDNYRFHASGRWMVRDMRVAAPDQPGAYGPDLIDRWKGRAFQSSPDSQISVVGFEDEQVNWEANSALLGERRGPVRAIREVWGADSGTNVTKTEKFLPGGIATQYRLRVHPIPSDGLYVAWDYNAHVADTYFNALHPEGVAIDGVNDDVGNIDDVGGVPAYFDLTDPTMNVPSAIGTWEQVSGAGSAGSLVYTTEIVGPTSLENVAVVPYYRDDACFDDGTGDDPVSRPWPGESSTDPRVQEAYAGADCDQRQGAWGTHGVHFFFTNDTDNAFVGPAPTTELDVQWWQFAVPTEAPTAVGERYAQLVRVPLQAVAVEQASTPGAAPTTLELTGDDSGQVTDEVTLAARLSGPDGPVAGVSVRFDFQGRMIEVTTGTDGVASTSVVVVGPSGAAAVSADFAGDDEHRASLGERHVPRRARGHVALARGHQHSSCRSRPQRAAGGRRCPRFRRRPRRLGRRRSGGHSHHRRERRRRRRTRPGASTRAGGAGRVRRRRLVPRRGGVHHVPAASRLTSRYSLSLSDSSTYGDVRARRSAGTGRSGCRQPRCRAPAWARPPSGERQPTYASRPTSGPIAVGCGSSASPRSCRSAAGSPRR